MSTYTQASALAYALAKLYRGEDTLTVIGGSHAKAFPMDCLRFFISWFRSVKRQKMIPELMQQAPSRTHAISD